MDDLHSRKLYTHKDISGISQGAILSGIHLKEYRDKEIWGLVITPRCDLARGIKYPTIHLLPIINLCDWLDGEGKVVFSEQNRKTVENTLTGLLPQKEFSRDIFNSGLSKEDIKYLIQESHSIKSENKEKALKLVDSLMDNDHDTIIANVGERAINNLVSELKKDNNAAYHVLEPWRVEDNELKVICLRRILEISREIGLRYKTGFLEEEMEVSVLEENNLRRTSARSGVYEIEAVVTSPFMEHLMQRFANNFTKVGVTDRPVTFEDHLKRAVKRNYGKQP